MGGKRWALLAEAGAVIVVGAALLGLLMSRSKRIGVLTGAVLISDPDPRDQVPISRVEIFAASGNSRGSTTSDSMGGFHLELTPPVEPGSVVALDFSKTEYEPVHLTIPAASNVLVVRLVPYPAPPLASGPTGTLANVRVRYATRSDETSNIGSAVRVFEVTNTGNVPCGGGKLCSPDGKWKASMNGITLDAGVGNVFADARVSCIAGPCPYSTIDVDRFSQGGRQIGVSVRNWSDTVTYLLEAEVYRSTVGDEIRHLYPVIFGRTLSFTLPADSQGPSLEADLDGTPIVFPLGPALRLSWAECTMKPSDHTKRYRCELKAGYGFK